MLNVNLSKYKNRLSKADQLKRLTWNVIWVLFIRGLPRGIGRNWILLLLRIFGAKVHKKSNVYSSVRIYAPWNLEMHEYSCLAPEVDCYNVDKVVIGAHSTVSQKTYLCTASHDISKSDNPLLTAPIILKDQAWVGASAFIGMGVTVGQGAVVGATSSVYKDVEPWIVVGGNPCSFIKKREINE